MKRGASELDSENKNPSFNSNTKSTSSLTQNNLTEESERALISRFAQRRKNYHLPPDENTLLRTKFGSIFSTQQPLSAEMLSDVALLLEKGANPNFYINNKTDFDTKRSRFISPLYYAIYHQDIKLFNLLLTHGANITAPCKNYAFHTSEKIKSYSDKNVFDQVINLHDLPLQQILIARIKSIFNSKINQEVLNEMYSTLLIKMKKEMPDFFSDIERKLEDVYCSILNILQAEINKSIKKNLKLLVLIGETHHTKFSYVVERMFCLIAQHLNYFDGLLLEKDKIGDYELTQENRWSRLTKMVKEKNLKVIPIDLAHNGPVLTDEKSQENGNMSAKSIYEWAMSTEGMKHRNEVMADTTIKNQAHYLGVVGADHLYGLEKETNLKEYFHITSINATMREKYGDKYAKYLLQASNQAGNEFLDAMVNSSHGDGYNKICREFYNSNQAIQMGAFLTSTTDALSTMLSLNEIDDIILKIHEKHTVKALPAPLLVSFENTKENLPSNQNASATVDQDAPQKLGINI
ncbi:MAG: hypothetical protein JSS07_02985 [Proteobacteria bacterium]|nr:hypothetical protein [Pseudomonadota bacterium]